MSAEEVNLLSAKFQFASSAVALVAAILALIVAAPWDALFKKTFFLFLTKTQKNFIYGPRKIVLAY